ncbi:MAG: hypothetical protein ACYC4L_12740, partial [Chloroflexota bacterium]
MSQLPRRGRQTPALYFRLFQPKRGRRHDGGERRWRLRRLCRWQLRQLRPLTTSLLNIYENRAG